MKTSDTYLKTIGSVESGLGDANHLRHAWVDHDGWANFTLKLLDDDLGLWVGKQLFHTFWEAMTSNIRGKQRHSDGPSLYPFSPQKQVNEVV